MSVKLATPRRVRCIDASNSYGELSDGVYYTVTHTWAADAANPHEMVALSELSGWWNASRFAIENNESTTYAVSGGFGGTGAIDCEYEEMACTAPCIGVATDEVFDFDRYNSLTALPGIRKENTP